jgi:GT2 family glycosyltransferase
MISIITAIHNQIEMNELFLRSLKKYTHHPYELIIIDNHSTDRSRELFEHNGAIVIYNDGNYSYPYCQNQGIKKASGDVLVFLNNDVVVSPEWDIHLLNVIGKNNYDAVSFTSNDRGANAYETKITDRRWKRIKYTLCTLCGHSKRSFQIMFRLMYPNWERYTKKVLEKYAYQLHNGFSGAAIAMTTKGIEKIGGWDERIQSADFDLYARTCQRHKEKGDIQPLSIIAGVYLHHYGRITSKAEQKPPQFVDAANLISMEEKWGAETYNEILKSLKQ